MSLLREFFMLLDKWDREQREEKSKESGDGGRNDGSTPRNNLKNLGQ
jgi:hypothetical protein